MGFHGPQPHINAPLRSAFFVTGVSSNKTPATTATATVATNHTLLPAMV